MTDCDVARKDDDAAELETVPVVDVQRRISELMSRAGFGKERIVLTRNGKQLAAIIGMDDLERLQSLGAVGSAR